MGANESKEQLECLEEGLIDPVQKKKNDRKNIECEVWSFGDEAAEGEAAWRECQKNPDHVTFIPVPEFNLDHLPPEYRETPVLYLIKAVSTLTVRLRVDFVSLKRPKGYTFSENKGSRVPHVGTGFVSSVVVGKGRCPCRECSKSKTSPPRTDHWFKIKVNTARHVLYDTTEARATRVDFFFDDENSAKEGKMISVWGEKCHYNGFSSGLDTCSVTCITHNAELCEILHPCLQQVSETHKSFKRSKLQDQLVVVVSHPHGQPKQVTLGKNLTFPRKMEEEQDEGFIQKSWSYRYNSDTCAGSSGAPVFVINSLEPNEVVQWEDALHSGFDPLSNHSAAHTRQFCGTVCQCAIFTAFLCLVLTIVIYIFTH